MGVRSRRGTRGSQRINRDFADRELGVAIEGLSLQHGALRPERTHPFDEEGAAMAQASKDSIGPKIAALKFARRLIRGEIGTEGVDEFIRSATYFRDLGDQAVIRVRGEKER